MKLDRKSKFVRMLENTLHQWKEENGIEHPFFYAIDHERNYLQLYSDNTKELSRARDDLAEMMKVASIRFKGYEIYELNGGTIY